MKFPPDGLRYGSARDLELTRQDEERCDRVRAWFKRMFRGLFAARRVAPIYGIIDPDYARIFTMARVLAWQEGYALLFHGSFTRDLDLIAVPWMAAACEPEHLLMRIASACDLNVITSGPKEHGRIAWTLTIKPFGDPRFVDFSIMPRQADTGRSPDKDKLYAVLRNHIPQDMIDGIWQEIEEAGVVSVQPGGV